MSALRERTTRVFVSLAFGIVALVAGDVSGQCQYDVTAIVEGDECPVFGRESVTASALNAHGHIVGWYACPVETNDHAFVWYGEGPMIDVPMPAGAISSRANDINDHGHVVGSVVIPGSGFMSLPFLFDGEQTIVLDVRPGDNLGVAHALNKNQQIVGKSGNTLTGPSPLPVAWLDGALVDPTDTVGDPKGELFDVNDKGQAVGWRGDGFLYGGRAVLVDLATRELIDVGIAPGASTGIATTVNRPGDVAGVGLYELPDGRLRWRSFVWSSGTAIDLGMLPGKNGCNVHGINALGQVVGSCTTATGSELDSRRSGIVLCELDIDRELTPFVLRIRQLGVHPFKHVGTGCASLEYARSVSPARRR